METHILHLICHTRKSPLIGNHCVCPDRVLGQDVSQPHQLVCPHVLFPLSSSSTTVNEETSSAEKHFSRARQAGNGAAARSAAIVCEVVS